MALSNYLFFHRINLSPKPFNLKFDVFGFVINELIDFTSKGVYSLYILTYFCTIMRMVVFWRNLKNIGSIKTRVDFLFFSWKLFLKYWGVWFLWFLCFLLWLFIRKIATSRRQFWNIDTSWRRIHRVCCWNATEY